MSVIPMHKGKRVYYDFKKIKPEDDTFDVIVIGSGIGGMACAAALAKKKYRVLVLEKHYIPGGFTHSYARKGYQWDAGVHAIGEMQEYKQPRKVLDWLSNNQIDMVSLGNPYDQFMMPDGSMVNFPDNSAEFVKELKTMFPEQSDAIDKYFKMVRDASKTSFKLFALKTMPEWLDKAGSRIPNRSGRDWWAMTTTEALDEAGVEGKLRTFLTVHWGYAGSIPDDSSFGMHALLHKHFWNGGYYPRHGSKVFAATFLGNVVDNGGLVLVNTPVTKINLKGNKATGVTLQDGTIFNAKYVISAAGAKNTINKMLPEKYSETKWGQSINDLEDSPPYICLNMGFKGDIKKAGARSSNLWLYGTWDNNQYYWDINDPEAIPHILYISFPSLKDPEHNAGPHEKHTGECVTFIDWKTVEKWKESTEENRPEDYHSFKEKLAERMIEVMKEKIPDVMKHLDYWELSTPLTTTHYTDAVKGAIYGLAVTPKRYACKSLRTRTPIKQLYLTGVDVGSVGVIGGMFAGVLTAATIEKSLFSLLIR